MVVVRKLSCHEARKQKNLFSLVYNEYLDIQTSFDRMNNFDKLATYVHTRIKAKNSCFVQFLKQIFRL